VVKGPIGRPDTRTNWSAATRTPTPVPRRAPDRELPYIHDYITKLCRQQAQVIRNNENANARHIGQGEARHRNHKRLKFSGGQAYNLDCRCSVSYMICCTEHVLTEVQYILHLLKTRDMYNVKLYWIFDNGLNTDDSDWQETDPASHQRGRTTETTHQLSDSKYYLFLEDIRGTSTK
jgi:hypothetical protein